MWLPPRRNQPHPRPTINQTTSHDIPIETMICANIRRYFSTFILQIEQLGVETVNDIPFDKLKNSLAIRPGGAVDYWNGRPTPVADSPIKITFEPSTFIVLATADGRGGISTIEKLETVDDTHIQLKTGDKYIFKDATWEKE